MLTPIPYYPISTTMVLGLIFNKAEDIVLLEFNPTTKLSGGIYGKRENNETPLSAMQRVSKDKTGHTLEWEAKFIINDSISVFKALTSDMSNICDIALKRRLCGINTLYYINWKTCSFWELNKQKLDNYWILPMLCSSILPKISLID